MITLHHLENSQSIRILWLLEELGVDYELKTYERDAQNAFLAPSVYKKRSPTGTAPFITDGNVVLSETNAIVSYILDTYGAGRLRPALEAPERLQYLFWFHAAQGSFQPLLSTSFLLTALKTRVPFFLKPIMHLVIGRAEKLFLEPRLRTMLGLIENDLALGPWFAGKHLTAADIVMGYCMEVAAVRVGLDKKYPNAQAFLARMRAHPSYKAAVEKAGGFHAIGS